MLKNSSSSFVLILYIYAIHLISTLFLSFLPYIFLQMYRSLSFTLSLCVFFPSFCFGFECIVAYVTLCCCREHCLLSVCSILTEITIPIWENRSHALTTTFQCVISNLQCSHVSFHFQFSIHIIFLSMPCIKAQHTDMRCVTFEYRERNRFHTEIYMLVPLLCISSTYTT